MKFTVGIIVVLVLSALLSPILSGGDALVGPERWGYLAGSAAAPVILGIVVLGLARLIGKARAPGAGVKVVFWTATIVLVLSIIGVAGRGAAAAGPITDAERQRTRDRS